MRNSRNTPHPAHRRQRASKVMTGLPGSSHGPGGTIRGASRRGTSLIECLAVIAVGSVMAAVAIDWIRLLQGQSRSASEGMLTATTYSRLAMQLREDQRAGGQAALHRSDNNETELRWIPASRATEAGSQEAASSAAAPRIIYRWNGTVITRTETVPDSDPVPVPGRNSGSDSANEGAAAPAVAQPVIRREQYRFPERSQIVLQPAADQPEAWLELSIVRPTRRAVSVSSDVPVDALPAGRHRLRILIPRTAPATESVPAPAAAPTGK